MICSPISGVCHCTARSCQVKASVTAPLAIVNERSSSGCVERDPLGEQRAPVVADEVDGLTDLLDLAHDPGGVLLFRRAEPLGHGTTEAGERGRDRVVRE